MVCAFASRVLQVHAGKLQVASLPAEKRHASNMRPCICAKVLLNEDVNVSPFQYLDQIGEFGDGAFAEGCDGVVQGLVKVSHSLRRRRRFP